MCQLMPERRRALHRVAAADGVVNLLELDKTDELSVAVVARARRGVAGIAAEVALQDGAFRSDGSSGMKRQVDGWLAEAGGMVNKLNN